MSTDTAEAPRSRRIVRLARELPYPSTPDVAGQVAARLAAGDSGQQGLAWASVAAAILVIVGGLMAVPPVRAVVFEIIGIGAVRIETRERAGSLEFPPAATIPLETIVDERTTLAAARERTGHALPLPAFPDGVGEPDAVYYQALVDGWAVFMLWTAADVPDRARMSLVAISSGTAVGKTTPTDLVETTVHGERALWVRGPHRLMLPVGGNARTSAQMLVESPVLIWESAGVTWRLESQLPMDEMRKIAESMAQ